MAATGNPAAEARQPAPGGGIYYGWWMVAITSVMSFFASGIFFRGFGVLVLPIRNQLDITQAQTNLIFSIARAEGGLEGPIAGWLIDKYGNRKVLVPSLIVTVIGYLVMAFWMPGFWAFALVYLGLVSLGQQHGVPARLLCRTESVVPAPAVAGDLHPGRGGLSGRPGPDPHHEPAHRQDWTAVGTHRVGAGSTP